MISRTAPNHRILVVAAHPDDEVLGCGGTIAAHVQRGDQVHVLIMAEGITSRDDQRDPDKRGTELSRLKKKAELANARLGTHSLELLDFPDNRLDSVDLILLVKAVEKAVAAFRPNLVYTHHPGDVNVDHKLLHRAVVTACRPVPGATVTGLYFFEVPSSSEWQVPGSAPVFAPNQFVNVSQTLAAKLEALACYDEEMRPWPHPRSIEAVAHLAKWRGATVGRDAAEAFVIGRQILE